MPPGLHCCSTYLHEANGLYEHQRIPSYSTTTCSNRLTRIESMSSTRGLRGEGTQHGQEEVPPRTDGYQRTFNTRTFAHADQEVEDCIKHDAAVEMKTLAVPTNDCGESATITISSMRGNGNSTVEDGHGELQTTASLRRFIIQSEKQPLNLQTDQVVNMITLSDSTELNLHGVDNDDESRLLPRGRIAEVWRSSWTKTGD